MQFCSTETFAKLQKILLEDPLFSEKLSLLLVEREELAQKMIETKDNIENEQITIESLKAYNPQKAKELNTHLENAKKKLHLLSQELDKIDEKIEMLEVKKEEEELLHSKKISNLFAKLNNEESQEIEQLLFTLKNKQHEEDLIKQINEHFSFFFEAIKSATCVPEAAKKRKFFDYIFGRNPKAVMSAHFLEAEKRGKILLSFLQECQQQLSSYQELLQTMLHTVTQFLNETQNPWNHKLYNSSSCANTFENISKLLHLIEKAETNGLQEDLRIRRQITEWIKMKIH